jgi:hypothetical protein
VGGSEQPPTTRAGRRTTTSSSSRVTGASGHTRSLGPPLVNGPAGVDPQELFDRLVGAALPHLQQYDIRSTPRRPPPNLVRSAAAAQQGWVEGEPPLAPPLTLLAAARRRAAAAPRPEVRVGLQLGLQVDVLCCVCCLYSLQPDPPDTQHAVWCVVTACCSYVCSRVCSG